MLIQAREFMKLSREERRAHLDLSDPCIDRCDGWSNVHHVSRGILAYFLGTTVPHGRDVQLCHACHNNRCSNPKHLYWGTYSDNYQDQVENGTAGLPRDRVIAKVGEDGWLKIVRNAAALGGAANRGKKKPYAPRPGAQKKRGPRGPRTWSVGSRKGIKMPRSWPRRKSVLVAQR